jgi:hypothetical protein
MGFAIAGPTSCFTEDRVKGAPKQAGDARNMGRAAHYCPPGTLTRPNLGQGGLHIVTKSNSLKLQKVFGDFVYQYGASHDPKRLSPKSNSNYRRFKDSLPKTFWDFPPKNTVQVNQKRDRT